MRQLHHEDQNWKYLKIGKPIKIRRNDAKFKTIKKLMEKLLTKSDNGKTLTERNEYGNTRKTKGIL